MNFSLSVCTICGAPSTGFYNMSMTLASSAPSRFESRCDAHNPGLIPVSIPNDPPVAEPLEKDQTTQEHKAAGRAFERWVSTSRLKRNTALFGAVENVFYIAFHLGLQSAIDPEYHRAWLAGLDLP